MHTKSRPPVATDTGRRRYDVPGASLRGPYKLWIPKTDNPQSESETEASRPAPSSSQRPHGHTTHVATGNNVATSPPTLRHTAVASQKQHTARTPLGYLSESSVHIPANSSKPSSSFSIFKPHPKESRGQPTRSTGREEAPRPTTVQATVSSRPTASQPVNVPRKLTSRVVPLQGGGDGSPSTLSSTDPSPRSSTDSGSRGGNASAPAAGHSDGHRQSYSTWNPYVDARIDRTSASRRNDIPSAQPRRDDNKTKDKEDLVARMTEALGAGSTRKSKAAEITSEIQAAKRDDIDSVKRTTPSTVDRGVEAQPSGRQNALSPRRRKATPHSTPFPAEVHLPDNSAKSSRPSASSRGHLEASSRSHAPSEPPAKIASSHSKVSTASYSKHPHPRSASSPWPFNQALPPEPILPPAKPQAHSSSWKQPFTRFQVSPQQPPDSRAPPKESTPHPSARGPSDDLGRTSRQAHTPSVPPQQSGKSPLPRGSPPSSYATATTSPSPPRIVPPPTPAPAPPPVTQTGINQLYTSSSTDPQRTSNATTSGRSAAGSGGVQQSHNTSQTSWTAPLKLSETASTNPPATERAPPSAQATTKRYVADGIQSNVASLLSPAVPQKSGTMSNVGQEPHGEARSPWPTTSKHSEQRNEEPVPTPVAHVRHPSTSMPSAVETSVKATERSISMSTTNPLWTTTSRNPEIVNAIPTVSEPAPVNRRLMITNELLAITAPPAGTWTPKYTQETYPSSDYETDDTSKEPAPAPAHRMTPVAGNGNSPGTPQEPDGASTPEDVPAGAWMTRSATGSIPVPTFETLSVPKPLPKAPGESPRSAASKSASASPAAQELPSRALRYATTNTVSTSQQPTTTTPGAWTTSTRYATNNSGSIFDSTTPTKAPSVAARETSARQATLGKTPVAGAWTTKQPSGSGTPSSSEATVKHSPTSQTPISNTPAPSSLLKPLPPSGTNTGSSTPSSTQISDLLNQLSPVTSHSISTRVPISGHPSTPAPIRPTLRATPPPLSISSTSPDTDSLLTPSSLNSPRSTIILPQSHPVATITAADVPLLPEKESVPRKNGFFDFFRPKPNPKSYEVWTPPARPKDRERTQQEQPKDPASTPPKTKQSAPVPIPPRPKSPKFFSPFKLFSKRHRTVSSASLDVLDGTAPNTMMNSPASSMRADTPGAPPSPPLRDAYLATQEWRNKEAAELVVSGRKRRHRPGVTFDCPEESAPVDILPSRLRIGRMQNYDDDDF